MRLYAAMLGGENDKDSLAEVGLGKARAQADRLDKAVGNAARMVADQVAKDGSGGHQVVFVAPEYFFSNQRHKNNRFFNHDLKRYILARLRAVARLHPTILVIPGTVLWTKPLGDAARIAKVRARQAAAVGFDRAARDAILAAHEAGARSEVGWRETPEEAAAKLDAARAKVRTEAAQTLDGQRASVGLSHVNAASFDQALDGENPMAVIAQNVAYVCKGDAILKYAKVGNSAELDGQKGTLAFAPGALAGRFKVGPVIYGLEVCMDHWLGTLAHSPGPRPHVQVITSSYVLNCEPHSVAAGVVLHASTASFGAVKPVTFPVARPDAPVQLDGPDNLTLRVISLDDGLFGGVAPRPSDQLEPIGDQGGEGPLAGNMGPVKHFHSLPSATASRAVRVPPPATGPV